MPRTQCACGDSNAMELGLNKTQFAEVAENPGKSRRFFLIMTKKTSDNRISPLTTQLKKEYVALWNNPSFKERFCNRKLKLDGKTEEWVLERDKCKYSEKKISGCKPEEIPCMELSDKQYEGRALLFVGMNPSGADKKSYSCNKEDVFVYGCDSPYYKAMAKFTMEFLTEKDGFSELDLFGIVQGNQSVVRADFLENPDYYKEMFDLFLKYLVLTQPKVIIVANAFACRVLCRDADLKLCEPEYDNFYKNAKYSLVTNDQFGGYTFTTKGLNAQLYFSSMLSGQRALDNGNKDNLSWMVRNYLRHNHKGVLKCNGKKDEQIYPSGERI